MNLKNKTVLPSKTDIAAVYGLLNSKCRQQVREICEDEHNIPERTFYYYLRSNRIRVDARSKVSRIIANVLNENTDFKWDICI